jgi:ubiquinone/menaquinone biosynthesis C-methylase UbiE
MIPEIERYWNHRIHDLEMTSHPVGTRAFFDDLDAYRFEKLHYLPNVVDFKGFRGRSLLEVGCGIGTDLVRFAQGGAICTGVDLSQTAIDLARKNVDLHGLRATLLTGNGEALTLPDASFDIVYAHGVLQYTADAAQLVRECHRVVKPGGRGIFMVYNRHGWLNLMSKLMKVDLEHGDAPVLTLFTIDEFRRLLAPFREVEIVPERFPVVSKLHKGWKAKLYNGVFVGAFNALPRPLVRRWGWHLMGLCVK